MTTSEMQKSVWSSLTVGERRKRIQKASYQFREISKWKGLSGQYPVLYNCWKSMRLRCTNPNHPQYKDWGGRGIKVCKLWSDNFPAFVKWALENGWEPGLQIDRRNNNGHYTPRNCRWVTRKVQNENKRRWVLTTEGAAVVNKWAKERPRQKGRFVKGIKNPNRIGVKV